MPTIDNLDIQISSSVNHANASLTTLIKRLDRVSASLSGVNSRGLATMGSGINKLSNAMSNFSANTRTADFTRLARNLTALSTVDTSAFGKMASGIASISSSLSKIPNISESASKFGELAKGISQLGYKSATQAINNIPKLATAMRELMATLSTAPRVSQNVIDMTNALAKLARTGASSGRATDSLSRSLNRFSSSTVRARKNSFSLASAIGKLYATYWLLFRAFSKIGDSIDIASNLTEVQNVVDVTFGRYASLVEKMSETSIQDFGMSELTVKQVSSRFQAMGTAMGFAQGQMADMSIELTKLTADMASFYNVEQKDVAEDLQSIFTGQTRPLRTYGLDLTEATLKKWAMRQGMEANIDTMSQMEKTMLRYQYVLANTGASQGDFARTSETWANQIRILRQQFEQLGIVIGRSFISALKPLVKALNSAMSSIIAFAETVSNALGKIFGWKFEVGSGGITNDLESGADYADDIAGGLGTASDNAKKLKSYLLGIDELNVIEPVDTDSVSGGAGAGTSGAGATGGQWTETETIFENFESELDTLYKLGDYISQTLSRMMESIDWDSVYKKAKNFGKGLADYLNGLISPRLFGNISSTISKALNTALYSLNSFGKTFNFEEFGKSIATAINDFFENFDFGALAETLNVWREGIWKAIKSAIDNIEWETVWESAKEFFKTLDFDTLATGLALLSLKFIDLKGSISNFALMLNSSDIKNGLDNTETALLGSVDATISWKNELSNVFLLLQDVGKATVVFGLVQEPLKDNFLDLLGITTDTKDVTDEMKERYNGLGGTVNVVKDTLSLLGNTVNSLPKIMSGAEYAGRAMALAFEEIAKGTIYTDEQLAKMQENWELTEEDLESLRQEMLDVNPELRTLADNLGLFDASIETLEDISTGMNLLTDGTVLATDAFKEFSKPMWGMTEDAKKFFKEIENGNFDLTDFQKELDNSSSHLETFSSDMQNTEKIAVTALSNIRLQAESLKNALSGLGGFNIGITTSNIQQYATGGFPNSADIFYANENGVPELVGTIGNRTAVASGTEITGISDAIYGTGEVQSSLLQTAVGLLQIIADKDPSLNIDGRELVDAYDSRKARNGYAF